MKSGSSFLYLQYPLKMNRTDLKDASGISFNVLANLNWYRRVRITDKFC